jgi:glycoprotein 6-alpha-L-fucosyltransferase/import inner membrane translocase subunit TIM50
VADCAVLLLLCCRLIDEMRSTVRCKANALYFDAHYTSPADMDLNW